MKELERMEFCLRLSRVMSEFYDKKITDIEISEQLMLIELKQEPTNKLIGAFINNLLKKKL